MAYLISENENNKINLLWIHGLGCSKMHFFGSNSK